VASDRNWWRDCVIYQVYVKSFADSDGDGIGDLDGLTARLGHLADLAVDGLWLNPCYPSPGSDGGYDVVDYLTIDPVYGGTAALERLIEAAHGHGIRVLLDVVPNHCSSRHPWFQQALAEGRDAASRQRFLFRDGRGTDGQEPPNNWRSVFGGPAWTRVKDTDGAPGQWYLHLFDPSQPDFNWRHPEVRSSFVQVLRHWFDRGVDGFRIDVASLLVKAPDLPDYDPGGTRPAPDSNQPEVHEIYRQWRAVANEYGADRDLVLVGEVWVPTADDVAAYVRADELHAAFYFDLLVQPWDARAFRSSTQRGLTALNAISSQDTATQRAGVLAWTLNNHDAHRAVSRYGLISEDGSGTAGVMGPQLRRRGQVDVRLGQARARAALLFLLGLPGSIYLYQGEELGLPEVLDLPDDARRDPIWNRSGGTEHGRDGSRVPLPWQSKHPTFGFSPDTAGEAPWLPQPAYFGDLAADVQATDSSSALSLYRAALSARRRLIADLTPQVRWLPAVQGREDVVAYTRGKVTVVTIFGGTPFDLPAAWGEIVLASATLDGRSLAGPGSAWLSL